MHGYVLSMGVRTLCFALAGFFVIVTGWMLPAWICVIGAIVLPYPAVVLANNTNRRYQTNQVVTPHAALATIPPRR